MSAIEIRPADKFPEPAFSRLSRLVFADVQQASAAFEAVLREEGAGPPADQQGQPPIVRFGAYDGDDLVGWSSGWMERGGIYYMANSGVLPDRRRQGIYAGCWRPSAPMRCRRARSRSARSTRCSTTR